MLCLWPLGVPLFTAALFYRNRTGVSIMMHADKRYESRIDAVTTPRQTPPARLPSRI